MRLLIDTHILIWLFSGDPGAPKLKARHRTIILDPTVEVMFSAASLWEIAIKVRLGRLQVRLHGITEAAAAVGFTRLPILDTHLIALAALPVLPDHRDPFDHLLIAQAIAEDLTLATVDAHTARYPVRILA